MTGPRTQTAAKRRALLPGEPLTAREIQILAGMAHGHPNHEIARRLKISPLTVKSHSRRVFAKLGALDRAHAVAIGCRTGLIHPDRIPDHRTPPPRPGGRP